MHPTDGAIATPHHLATRAGQRAYEQGGTAVDAALAAATVLTVVYPHMCAIGGDVQAIAALPGGAVRALNGTGATAGAASAAALRPGHERMPIHGVHPVTVPGMVAAWGELHQAGGRLPWKSLFTEAIALAAAGVPVAAALGRDLAALHERLGRDPGLRGVFFHPDGRVLREGERLVQPALARSLGMLADLGPRAMYEGEVGRRYVAGLQAMGSALRPEDLAAHRSEWTAPVATRTGALDVLTTRAPSQGYVLLQLVAALERAGLAAADPLGPDAALLARLCAQTAFERDRQLGDPRHAPVDLERWTSPATIERLLAACREPGWTLPPTPAPPRPAGDTVAIAAQDAQGGAVTLIQSIFHAFGAGLLEPSTGIVCHNRGAAFTLHEGPAWLVGGMRPPTTLTPSLLMRGGRPFAAFGAMGGKSQPQILAQLLMRLQAGMPMREAMEMPRWVVGTFGQGDEIVVLAEGATPAAAQAALAAAGLPLVTGQARDDRAGHAQYAGLDAAGRLRAATDPRGDGDAPAA